MHIRRVQAATKALVADGMFGSVTVADSDGLALNAQVQLSSGALVVATLRLVEIKEQHTSSDIVCLLIDSVTGLPFDASAFLVSGSATLTIPAQMLLYGLNGEGPPIIVYDEAGLDAVLAGVSAIPLAQSVVPEKTIAAAHSVSVSLVPVVLSAAHSLRRGATVYNDSTGALYIQINGTPSLTSYAVKLFQDDYFVTEFGCADVVEGLWDGGTGAARVVEYFES